MTRWTVVALTAVMATPVWGAGLGLKPGLWEVRVVKQVIDGEDRSAQMAAALERMQQSLASLPPDQKARLEAMLKQNGISQGSNGSFRICVSSEMAQRDAPVLDREGRCQPARVTHGGNSTQFDFSCTTNGTTMTGKGVATVAGDLIKTHTEVNTHSANGATHATQNETEMRYLGSNCGDLKPPALPARP